MLKATFQKKHPDEVKVLKIIFIVSILLLFSSLLITCIGDVSAVVKGKAIGTSGQDTRICWLELYLQKNDEFIFRYNLDIDTDGNFDRGFTISPYDQKYYMIIRCSGSSNYHKTKTFKMGGAKNSENIINLGTIHINNVK
jgi:hypothetical protein